MRAFLTFLVLCSWIISHGNPCWAFLLPRAKITIKVVNEQGTPVEMARVGLGFERNTGWGTKEIPVVGFTDDTGVFAGSAFAMDYVGYRVEKEGYYQSFGKYTFEERKLGRWLPWNPQVEVSLRRIENRVPMYARDTKKSGLEIPRQSEPVGFDLIKYDWVFPHGKGETADFVFELVTDSFGPQQYDAKLRITFSNEHDGIMIIGQDRREGSMLKLPRVAPEFGYQAALEKSRKKTPSEPIDDNFDDNNNYFFRVRSEEKNGIVIRAMYGKIQGDIKFYPSSPETAALVFTYFLNPDYTRNLEFGDNLFKDLPERERVWIGQ